MTLPQWDRRIRRANELTSTYPFAAEGLRFYSCVATFQKSLYEEIQKTSAVSPKISSEAPLRDELDLFALLPKFPGFLSAIERVAPVPLAQAAVDLSQKGSAAWQRAIQDFWQAEAESPADVSAEEDATNYAHEAASSQRWRRSEEVADLYAMCARMEFSKNLLPVEKTIPATLASKRSDR